MKKTQFHVVAFGAQGNGVSGGDRIFIEIARRLPLKYEIHLWVSDEGKEMCERMNLLDDHIIYHISQLSKFRRYGNIVFNLSLVLESLKVGLLKKPLSDNVLYSASEFWMDVIPALFWKVKNKNVQWIASWYQTAPSPLTGFSLTGTPRDRMAAVPYWFFQKTTKPFISRLADKIAVNNVGEKDEFPNHKRKDKIFIMYGAVDTKTTAQFALKHGKLSKTYDAVFQGRFHPQKGVLELIDIWNLVTKKLPNAQLVLIGDGPLMLPVQDKIEDLGLQDNITLLGYVFDGKKKYRTFMQSKLVVHPAFYDSGGMASAEAMAFGLPCVGFDLPSYKDYYPKGMLKVPQTKLAAFSDAVIKLLTNKRLYKKYSVEAKNMVAKSWSWDRRVDEFSHFIEI